MVDAWLGNWSGVNYGNYFRVGDKPKRVDCTGALLYRAGGSKKGTKFGGKVVELDTFHDNNVNFQTFDTFQNISQRHTLMGAARVINISRETIETLVREYGPRSRQAQDELIETLISRQQDIASRFPDAAHITSSVHIVEPGGFETPESVMSSNTSLEEPECSDHWLWLDLKDCRARGQKEMPLDRSESGVSCYLDFEQQRIQSVMQKHFQEVTVEIKSVSEISPKAPEETTSGVGVTQLTLPDRKQAVQVHEWLQNQGVTNSIDPSGTVLEVLENPNCFYRKITAVSGEGLSMGAPTLGLSGDDYSIYPKAENKPEDQGRYDLKEALFRLKSARERLAVAAVYRDTLKETPDPQAEISEPALEDLIPVHTDKSGEGIYCNHQSGQWFKGRLVSDRAAARNEVLMARLAEASGLPVPRPQMFEKNDKAWVFTPWQENLQKGSETLKQVDKRQRTKLFLASVWLGNRGVIGRGFDHSAIDDQGLLCSLNWGGAGYFNSSRKRKHPGDGGKGGFLGTPFELDDLRGSSPFYSALEIFGDLTDQDIEAFIPEFLASASENLVPLVETFGPEKKGEQRYLLSTLSERLGYLAMRYPGNLRRVTHAELLAVSANGLHGYEIPVVSTEVEGSRVRIGHQLGSEGVGETRVSLKLGSDKTAEFARVLGLGKSHHDLEDRLSYFLGQEAYREGRQPRKMTESLQQDIQTTLTMARELKQQLQERETRGILVSGDREEIETSIEQLERCIVALFQISLTAVGSDIHNSMERAPLLKLPVFLPEQAEKREKVKGMPEYHVTDRGWQTSDYSVRIAGGGFFYRVELDPEHPIPGLPQSKSKIVLEFHGPDSDATSFEGQVRLTAQGQDEKAAECVLNWLCQAGIDCRRPDAEQMQYDYEQHLSDRPDAKLVSPVRKSARWEKNTRRVNGRIVQLLPEERRIVRREREKFRPTHNLATGRRLKLITERGLALCPYTERVNSGARPDGISSSRNIRDNSAKLVFTTLSHRDDISVEDIVLHSRLLNRVDHIPLQSAMFYQPWRLSTIAMTQDQWLKKSFPQCDFAGSVSLPESMECIIVQTENERQEAVRTLKQDFDCWPDGRTPEQLVKCTVPLSEQYDEVIKDSEDNDYPENVRALVKQIGYGQFQQFLSVNPDFQRGGYADGVSLEGITLKFGVKLSGLKLTSLKNASLLAVTFTDCKISDADLDLEDFSRCRWVFTSLEDSVGDRENLFRHIENQFVTSKETTILYRLLSLLHDSGCVREASVLLGKYGQHLSESRLCYEVEKLKGSNQTDFGALVEMLAAGSVHIKCCFAQRIET